ncbi:MAG: XRE family transcriptional regulator [Burkholderiaceae bacterium]|nr:MAG: XRE family transcriptional regulator [Burkholderiaceae bacterium]
MNKPIDFQTILGADGAPAFVVMPYAEFIKSFEGSREPVPDAVMKRAFDDGMSPATAWRTHPGPTQTKVMQRIGITQSACAQCEASKRPRTSSREKMAAALGISPGQLDF